MFESLFLSSAGQIRILDVGGTVHFWEQVGFRARDGLEITLLNLTDTEIGHPNFKSHMGDARDMTEFDDNQFDVVFSNSVIEHVGHLSDQRRMAREVRRVGRSFFLQTPNRYFPIESHFRLPFFQFLPRNMQILLLDRSDFVGRRYRLHNPDLNTAVKLVESVNLLSANQLRNLFPDATIVREKFLGATKSLMVYQKNECGVMKY